MTGSEVLRRALVAKFPAAEVTVSVCGGEYTIEVVWDGFATARRADREAAVYSAVQSLPLGLVAKITRIDTRVA